MEFQSNRENESLVLSITDVLTWQNCQHEYFLKKVQRLKSEVVSANLPFGNVIHDMCDEIIKAYYFGDNIDLDALFELAWTKYISGQELIYSAHFDEESMRSMGLVIVRRFNALWPDLGYLPLVDENDDPVQSKLLECEIGEDVIIRGKLDFQGFDFEADYAVIDFKATRNAHDEDFALGSDQLTGYQLLSDANRKITGAPPVDKVGFMDAIKRKVPTTKRGQGPTISKPMMMDARSKRQLDEFRDKVLWMADDIRRGRFPKSQRMAHNTPCSMCDFHQLCTSGDMTGLCVRESFIKNMKAA